ncbi:MAG: nitrite/sulfite reductase [Candidatus Aramenus sp.]|jgi:ferredoxin-nitrite reductase|nr:nitrite/sulfite reductase [Candidatus Aramenus sp.]
MVKFAEIFKEVNPRKFEGLYKSRGDNELISIRIRQGKGRDPSKWYSFQLRKLAEISERYGNGKVQLTTRGDVELYEVNYKLADKVIAELAEAELAPRDSCGTVVRNVIPCPSHLCPLAKVDAEEFSEHIADYFRFKREYETLPKRFKVSISACEGGCASPATMDVGIVAKGNGVFEVRLGGGIGEHAFSSQKAFEVTAEMVLPVVIASVELLKREGEKRGFKWVVKKYGLEKVKEMILEEARKIGKDEVPDLSPKYLDSNYVRVHVPTGWISSEKLRELADFMDCCGFGFGVLFNRQSIDIPYKVERKAAYERLKGLGLDLRFKDRGEPYSYDDVTVVSCIGNDYCPPALINTTGIGLRIYDYLKSAKYPRNFKVNISGCTHSCGMHWIADLGFGAFSNRGDVRVVVTMGGDSSTHIGKIIGTVKPEDAEKVVEEVVKMYEEEGEEGDFRGLLDKVGYEKVAKRLTERISSFEVVTEELEKTFH